ncbi:recombinase RecA [Halomonas sp. ND22Bw]|uniref:DUF2190 family protein n=1 Tax=Halomonas sp. ND22Bw TaxID=2054178 RepID=UPI000D0B2C01|nr:recombinase RecA [Halomonas sp. ND22Bw]
MAKNCHQMGDVLDWTNDTGSTVSSGQVVVIGALIGVALVDIANGATGSVAIDYVWELPKGSNAIGAGERVDYDISASVIDQIGTPASGDLVGCGVAIAAAAGGDATVLVKINARGAAVTA